MASVVQNGAALASMILVGDVIVQIDNEPVIDSQSLGLAEQANHNRGDSVAVHP